MIKRVFVTSQFIAPPNRDLKIFTGAECTQANGQTVLVGYEDIFANPYTYQSLKDAGLVLYPYVVTLPGGMLVLLVCPATHGLPEMDMELTIRSKDPELMEALINRQPLYPLYKLTEYRDMMLEQLIMLPEKMNNGTARVDTQFETVLYNEQPADGKLDFFSAYQMQKLVVPQALPMDDETKPLGLTVPEYSRLRMIYDLSKVSDIEEDLEEVIEDYTAPDAEATAVFSGINMSAADPGMFFTGSATFASLKTPINDTHFNVSKGYPYYDSIAYEVCSDISQLPFNKDYIVGSHTNDELPIQDNERIYYEALLRLIRRGIQEEKGILLLKDLEAALTDGTRSIVVDRYLQDMSELAFALGRKHTGHCSRGTLVVSEESDVDYGQEYEGLYTISRIGTAPPTKEPLSEGTLTSLKDEFQLFDGFDYLKSYVDNHGWAADTWAKVLIALLRFGSRKPAYLLVPGKDPSKRTYFDLELCKTTSLSGDKTLWELVPLEDGADYAFGGMVTANYNPVPEATYIQKSWGVTAPLSPLALPVGVILNRKYRGIEGTEHTFVDMFTFVELITSKKLRVSGISCNGEGTAPFTPIAQVDSLGLEEALTWINTDGNLAVVWRNVKLIKAMNTSADNVKYVRPNQLRKLEARDCQVFNLLKLVLVSPNLTQMEEIAQLVLLQDEAKRGQLFQHYSSQLEDKLIPVLYDSAIELAGQYLTVYQALYETHGAPVWTPDQIFNMFYQASLQSAIGKTSAVRNNDTCFAAFAKNALSFDQYYKIVNSKAQVVGFLHYVPREKNNGASAAYCWAFKDYTAPPVEKLVKQISLEQFKNTFGQTYLRWKAEGNLARQLNTNLFMPSATTMETFLQMPN